MLNNFKKSKLIRIRRYLLSIPFERRELEKTSIFYENYKQKMKKVLAKKGGTKKL